MKRNSTIITALALILIALPLIGQLKNRVEDSGTAVEMGSMVKLNASGQITVCGDSDTSVAGIVVAVLPDGGTDYYLLSSSDIFPARMEASVTAGDRLTTATGGKLKTASDGDVFIGFALENGHATEVRKAIISLDYPISVDWDTLGAYADTSVVWDTLGDYALLDTLSAYYDTTDLQTSGDAEVHWDNLTNVPADLADGDDVDTTIAYWGSLRNIPADIADGDDLGFQQLRANGSAWLPDSVTFVEGSNITLTQTGDSITIAATGADTDWIYNVTDGGDTTLMTGGKWGIARSGATLYGNADSTHVNLGVGGKTGTSGQNYKYCTVAGGFGNTASYDYATVGGGQENIASGIAFGYSTVNGGYKNTASGDAATVGGGFSNIASGDGATVGGGYRNLASGDGAIIPGGNRNIASGFRSVISGGEYNAVSDSFSAIPCGYADTVSGKYSFAFGRHVVVGTDYTSQFYSSDYNGILRTYGNIEFSDTLLGGIGAADSLRIFDDGDTTRFESDNAIKIGDGSLIVGTNGYAYATKNLYAGDSFYIGDIPDTSEGSYLLVPDSSTGQVKKMNWTDMKVEATIYSYSELYENDSTLYDPVTSGTWYKWTSGTSGLSSGSSYIVPNASAGTFTIGSLGEGRYFIMYSASVKAQGANQKYEYAVFKNGVKQSNLTFRMRTTNANGFYGATVSGFLYLVEDDYIDFRFRNLGSSTGVRFYSLNFNLQKVGD
ncbi:hypothetical protein KAH81_07725 [bacterium]|nr:hypothetical protein [bacterium]